MSSSMDGVYISTRIRRLGTLVVFMSFAMGTLGMRTASDHTIEGYNQRLERETIRVADTAFLVLVTIPVCGDCIYKMAKWSDTLPVQAGIVFGSDGSRAMAAMLLQANSKQYRGYKRKVVVANLAKVFPGADDLANLKKLLRYGPVLYSVIGHRTRITEWSVFDLARRRGDPWQAFLPE